MSLEFIKEDKLKMQQIPKDGLFHIYKDRYWAVDDGKILFYKSYCSPQCNRDKRIMEKGHWHTKYGFQIEFIETVFVPHSCSDYV